MLDSLFSNLPFDRYRLINTSDREEAQHQIGNVLSPYRLQVVRGQIIHSRLELLRCGELSLIRMRDGYGADIRIDLHSQALEDYYLLVLPTRGHAVFQVGDHGYGASSKSALILSPGKRFYFTAGHDYEQILLRIEGKTMDAAWRRLTGCDEAALIDFDAEIHPHSPAWLALMPMLQWVARCVAVGPARQDQPARLLAETETLLATTLLLHQVHNRAAQLWPAPVAAASALLRRAQTYMLDHLSEPLPVGLVASHCGLSVRRLQALFRDECGLSPLQWLREQRLQAIRRVLQQGEVPSISQAALCYGFSHLGEFSRAYRKRFGETATQTRGPKIPVRRAE